MDWKRTLCTTCALFVTLCVVLDVEGPDAPAGLLAAGGTPPRHRRYPPVLYETFFKEHSKTDQHLAIQYIESVNATRRSVSKHQRSDQIFRLLRILTQFLEHNNVVHWIDWGSLLGSVRDGDIILWDDDGDIGITDSSYLAVVNASHNFAAAVTGYDDVVFVVRYFRPEKLPFGHPHDIPFMIINTTSGIYIDVFMYREIKEWDEDVISNRMKDTRCHFSIRRDAVLPPQKKCRIRNVTFYCPRRSVEYLGVQFGEDWKVPVQMHP